MRTLIDCIDESSLGWGLTTGTSTKTSTTTSNLCRGGPHRGVSTSSNLRRPSFYGSRTSQTQTFVRHASLDSFRRVPDGLNGQVNSWSSLTFCTFHRPLQLWTRPFCDVTLVSEGDFQSGPPPPTVIPRDQASLTLHKIQISGGCSSYVCCRWTRSVALLCVMFSCPHAVGCSNCPSGRTGPSFEPLQRVSQKPDVLQHGRRN